MVASRALPSSGSDPVAHLAVATSHPAWIVGGVHDALACLDPERTWDDTRVELLADNSSGAVTLVARTLGREELTARLAEQGVVAHDGTLSRFAVRVDAVNPATIPEVATGAAGVQDEGSQLVALVLAGAALDGPEHVAGPVRRTGRQGRTAGRAGGERGATADRRGAARHTAPSWFVPRCGRPGAATRC